jgi:hypothetical protein
MTKAEIARLKKELADDYERKLEALELVEQMLDQRRSPIIGAGKKARRTGVPSAAVASGDTIAARVEQAFEKRPKWETPALMRAIGVKYRSNLWKALNQLVKTGKVRVSRRRGKGLPSEYTRVAK